MRLFTGSDEPGWGKARKKAEKQNEPFCFLYGIRLHALLFLFAPFLILAQSLQHMEPAIYQMLRAMQILGKSIPDKENSKGKGPDVSVLVCWRDSKENKGRERIGLRS